MKRFRFGLGLLAALLILGLFFAGEMGNNQQRIAHALRSAAGAAAAEDWPRAEAVLGEAREQWEKKWHFTAALADHEPMEEIDGLFAQAQVYLDSRDPQALGAVCAQLARAVEAVGDAHALSWWNLL